MWRLMCFLSANTSTALAANCWRGFKSLPWHHVITPNRTCHPNCGIKGMSGIAPRSYKTIKAHLNVSSSIRPTLLSLKPSPSHNPSLSLWGSSLISWFPHVWVRLLGILRHKSVLILRNIPTLLFVAFCTLNGLKIWFVHQHYLYISTQDKRDPGIVGHGVGSAFCRVCRIDLESFSVIMRLVLLQYFLANLWGIWFYKTYCSQLREKYSRLYEPIRFASFNLDFL